MSIRFILEALKTLETRVIEEKTSQQSISDPIKIAYQLKVAQDLQKIIKDITAPVTLRKEFISYLRKNDALTRGSDLYYTSLPCEFVSQILYKVAEWVSSNGESGERPMSAFEVLVPSLALSSNEPLYYPDLCAVAEKEKTSAYLTIQEQDELKRLSSLKRLILSLPEDKRTEQHNKALTDLDILQKKAEREHLSNNVVIHVAELSFLSCGTKSSVN